MTILYVTENNCKGYGVTFQNNGYVKVQKFKDVSNDENTIYCVKPMKIFLGKSQVFDGNNFLLEISEENGKKENIFILVVIRWFLL